MPARPVVSEPNLQQPHHKDQCVLHSMCKASVLKLPVLLWLSAQVGTASACEAGVLGLETQGGCMQAEGSAVVDHFRVQARPYTLKSGGQVGCGVGKAGWWISGKSGQRHEVAGGASQEMQMHAGCCCITLPGGRGHSSRDCATKGGSMPADPA